jgi:hypothetical protein
VAVCWYQFSRCSSCVAVQRECWAPALRWRPSLPGAVHDLTAARIWGIIRELTACGLVVLGDKGYLGEHIRVPYGGRNKPAAQKEATGSCPAARSRRARQRPASVLAHPAQAPLLPLESRAAGQGHPRPSGPRNRSMKTLTALNRAATGRSARR